MKTFQEIYLSIKDLEYEYNSETGATATYVTDSNEMTFIANDDQLLEELYNHGFISDHKDGLVLWDTDGWEEGHPTHRTTLRDFMATFYFDDWKHLVAFHEHDKQ